MTTKDYQLIANAISTLSDPHCRRSAAEALIPYLAADNPRFSGTKFIVAATTPANERRSS